MAGELNFGLLDQGMPAKIAGSVIGAYQAGQQQDQANALAQAQLQHAQSQNELSKYTLGAAKRTDEQQNALSSMMQQGFDPASQEHLKKLYAYGPAGQAMVKSIQEGQVRAADVASKKVKTAKETQDFFNQGKRDLSMNPSDANVTAWTEDAVLQGIMTQEQANQSLQHMLAMPPAARKAFLERQGATAGDISTAATAKAGQDITLRGQDIGAETSRRGQDIGAITARRGQDIGAITARRGQDIGATTAATGHAIQREGQALKPQGLVELPPKEIQKREAKYPAATAAVKEATKGNEQLIKDLEALKTHKGLDGITGVVYGRTPSVAEASREAKAKFDKIMARGGFSELAKMRAASPTGGALGNISDTEGKYLRAAFAAMDPTQSKESFQKAIDDAVEELKGSNVRLQDAYDMTYEYKQGGAAPKPAAPKPAAPKPAAPGLSPAEQAELDALRKRFNK